MFDAFASRRERTALLSIQPIVDDLVVNGELLGVRQQLSVQLHVLPNGEIQIDLLFEAFAALASSIWITVRADITTLVSKLFDVASPLGILLEMSQIKQKQPVHLT